MSFVLKPQGMTSGTLSGADIFNPEKVKGNKQYGFEEPSISNCVFTAPSNHVPAVLEGRISSEDWFQTWNNVAALVDRRLIAQNNFLAKAEMNLFLMIPCFVCCTAPYMISKMVAANNEFQQESAILQNQWLQLVQAENEKYQAAGISITLATETVLVNHGARENRTVEQQTVPVGLSFQVGPSSSTVGPIANAVPVANMYIDQK